MYSAIAVRALAWVGNTVRCTSSFFRLAKKLSAAALSQQMPVRPIEPSRLLAASAAANSALVYWAAPVGMEHTIGAEPTGPVRHRQGVDDQGGAHVLGHGPADGGSTTSQSHQSHQHQTTM